MMSVFKQTDMLTKKITIMPDSKMAIYVSMHFSFTIVCIPCVSGQQLFIPT